MIDPSKYQFFLMYCPANLPFSFAIHPWFVCNEKGTISRWEVLFRENKNSDWWHLHEDKFPPFSGIEILPFSTKWLWQGKILAIIEGNNAERLIEIIKSSKENYPHKTYSLIGTNSNTYVQWVLSQLPELGLSLPWNAFGKGAGEKR